MEVMDVKKREALDSISHACNMENGFNAAWNKRHSFI